MLTRKELMWIEDKKKEYFKEFNKTIYISIKGNKRYISDKTITKWLKTKSEEYKVPLSVFNKKIKTKNVNAKLFLKEYGNYLFDNGLDLNKYAKFVNRDRTTLMYHLKK